MADRLGTRPLNATPGGLIGQRCDPYGAESQVRLFGGMYPEAMRGRHMWHCDRPAEGWYRMVCECGHEGQAMPLCGPGVVTGPDGVAYQHPGHVAELMKRQAGLCPACVWPPQARVFKEAGDAAERDLRSAMWRGDQAGANRARQAMEDAGAGLQELNERRGRDGKTIIHKCPLHLEERS